MNKVYVHHLKAEHQSESFREFRPLSAAMKEALVAGVKEIFDKAGGASLLKSSGDVYIKPNAIDAKPYCYTRPELIEALISYWKKAGAKRIYFFENSTQSNLTRIVFKATGYTDICRRSGAIPVYLDEGENVLFGFKGKDDYEHSTFEMPRFIADNLIRDKEKNLYITVPKLKTHSMAGLTLGVKNQWAFPRQNDRRHDHNFNLANKLVDVLSYLQPDFTLIEGVEGTIYGHYPVLKLADKCIIPFRLLIGSANVLASDLTGMKVFGLSIEDVPHLKLAIEAGYGGDIKTVSDIDKIEIDGDISMFNTSYPAELYDSYPPDVRLVKGKTRLCKQGCLNNPLTLLQVLYNDFGGKGGWTLVMGKGHDPAELDSITGRVLIAGDCAITETGERLEKRLGRKNVYYSHFCNDLCASLTAMCHLMKVNPTDMVPLSSAKLIPAYISAKLNGSKGNIPNPLAHIIKLV
ncbi:MAG: DUF362 domain-containing protein [Spirochaetaceae bacterium]|jgi:uncharacterized protein (DUF362 family)|nr:DUF362 domain-containing protein [Spirochaetaceae bacterium]